MTTLQSTDGRYELARSQLLDLRLPEGAMIVCAGGLVWITQKGHPDDYWLPVGDRVAFAPGARILIEAAQASRLIVTRLPRTSLAAQVVDRIGAWLASAMTAARGITA